MKKSEFADGDVFEIILQKDKFAYCRVIGRQEYGPFFELFKEIFRKSQEIDDLKRCSLSRIKIVFINKFSLKNKKKARFVGNYQLTRDDKKHPPIFQGSPGLFWRVYSDEGIQGFSPDKISYEELLAKGYIDSTLYPTESIQEFYLKKKPLVFEPNLKKWTPQANHSTRAANKR